MIPLAKKNAMDVQNCLRALSETTKAALNIVDFDITVESDGSHVVSCSDKMALRCTPLGFVSLNYATSENIGLPDVPVLTPICLQNITLAVYYLLDLRAAQLLQKSIGFPTNPEMPNLGDDTLFS